MFQNAHPKKVFLNYNFLKKDYSTDFSKDTTRRLSYSFQEPKKQFQKNIPTQITEITNHKITFPEYCYVLYVDQIESLDFGDYCLKFKLKDCIKSITRKEIQLDEQIYNCFEPYSAKGYPGATFKKIKNNTDLLNAFYSFKLAGDEIKIRQLMEYFFTPSLEFGQQIINDIKNDLKSLCNLPVNVLAFFDGQEINNISQIMWNPPTLLCASSYEILINKRTLIQQKLQISKQLQTLNKLKDSLLAKYSTQQYMKKKYDQTDLNQKPLQQGQQYQQQQQQQQKQQSQQSYQQQKQVINSIYLSKISMSINNQSNQNSNQNTPSLPSINRQKSVHYTNNHLDQEQIKFLREIYPELSVYQIYQFYIDYKSLCLLSQLGIVQVEHFTFLYLRQHDIKEVNRIYQATGVSVYTKKIEQSQFIKLRVLMENSATYSQMLDFLYDYFEPINGQVNEEVVSQILYELGSRIQNQNGQKKFAEKFVYSLMKWMHDNTYFTNGQLNKSTMLQNIQKQEYVYKFIIDSIFGQFTNYIFDWFYHIY